MYSEVVGDLQSYSQEATLVKGYGRVSLFGLVLDCFFLLFCLIIIYTIREEFQWAVWLWIVLAASVPFTVYLGLVNRNRLIKLVFETLGN